MKRLVLSTLIAAITASSVLAVAGSASADEWRGRRYYDRHHHHDNGGAIAGGLAAGVIGGLIGGAIVNSSGPRYIDPPPPPPRCWFEDRRVPNAYDGGWHMESIRVCR